MGFSIATFNVRDLFDDTPPNVIGELDRGPFGDEERLQAQRLYRAKLQSVAAVVQRLDADVVAFQEVKNARVLDDVRALLPARDGRDGGGYGPAVVASSDGRGIACGLLSRFPVTERREHLCTDLSFPRFSVGDPVPFPGRLYTHRPVLEATCTLPDGTSLVLFVVHLKSNLPMPLLDAAGEPQPFTDQRAYAEGSARSLVSRIAEALFVRSLVDERLDREPGALLAVAGDFNDHEGSVAVRAVTGDLAVAGQIELASGLAGSHGSLYAGRGLYPCARAIPTACRYTLLYRSSPQQPDHVLVSRALWARFVGARILNETLHEDEATGDKAGLLALASDHAPLRAEFL